MQWSGILVVVMANGIVLVGAILFLHFVLWQKIRPQTPSVPVANPHPPHYDKLLEFAMKMNQVIALSWLLIEQEKKVDPNSPLKVWRMPFSVIYKGDRMEASIGSLIQEYSMFLPSRICEMCIDIDTRAARGKFDEAQEKIFDVYEWFQRILGVNQNRQEIRSILMLIARNGEKVKAPVL